MAIRASHCFSFYNALETSSKRKEELACNKGFFNRVEKNHLTKLEKLALFMLPLPPSLQFFSFGPKLKFVF